MKTIYEPKIEEKIEKSIIDPSIWKKKSSAKSFTGYLIGKMKKARDEQNLEILYILNEIYKKYKRFETISRHNLYGWQGKSSFEIFKRPDSFLIVSYQRPDKNSPYKPVETIVSKKDVNLVWIAINNASESTKIATKRIAEEYCVLSNLTKSTHGDYLFKDGKFSFEAFFSDRATYIPFNKILRLLDHFGMIKYVGGVTEILKGKTEIQTILK